MRHDPRQEVVMARVLFLFPPSVGVLILRVFDWLIGSIAADRGDH
jgi:hypothetical protein